MKIIFPPEGYPTLTSIYTRSVAVLNQSIWEQRPISYKYLSGWPEPEREEIINNDHWQISIMKPIVCKYRVLLEREWTSYESGANNSRVYPIASCEPMNQQVTKLIVCEAVR